MVDIKFEYSKQAKKFFLKHEDVKKSFQKSIYSLFTGEQVDIKKMKGTKEPIFRIRINSYRVLFKIIDGQVVVIDTILAGNRGEIYKQFK